ncbi:MAG: GTP-sensing pleiotropic transcriptional regulator CodY [Lachnospiraceae bacterium]|nr:GTP-sensing pleiotropic transcriptional regulator CodY [Lachnospiraceae bacterium]
MTTPNNVQLLDKTRKIEKLLHNNSTGKVVFNDICKVMSDILNSDVLVLSKKGKVLGVAQKSESEISPIEAMMKDRIGDFIDNELNERLLSILSTNENVMLSTLGFVGDDAYHNAIISPIEIAGERLGTVFIYNQNKPYEIDDIIICEYGTTVVGLEMLRAVTEESAEENRKTQIVKSAIGTLSYTEIQAILHIFDEMEGKKEGILVASKIADKAGITRSVIVNALRKFESAGVIESRSSGMKGTYIKVLNDAVYKELVDMKNKVEN